MMHILNGLLFGNLLIFQLLTFQEEKLKQSDIYQTFIKLFSSKGYYHYKANLKKIKFKGIHYNSIIAKTATTFEQIKIS